MAKIPLGPQAHEFQIRSGADPLGPSGWRGVNTEIEPGSLDPNELVWGENIRLRGKSIFTRPGMSLKLDLGVAAGSVMYLGALPVNNPRYRLWASALGAYGTTILTGSNVSHVDPTELIAYQDHSHFYRSTDRQLPMGRYGTHLYIGNKDRLCQLLDIAVPPGLVAVDVVPTPPISILAVYPALNIRCLIEFDAKLFVGLEDEVTPAASKISAWNSLNSADDLTGVRPPLAFGLWRNKLVAGFDATAGHIRVRDAGAAPGTWTTYALAGFLCATQGNAMAEERQYLYIASGNDKIFRFDGAALTLVRTIAGCAVDGSGVTALALHNGLLYYGWNTPGAAYASRIGRHDPDSTANEWVDTYKDITTEVPNFKRLSSLASYRGQLYAGGQQAWIVATPRNDVQGALEKIKDTGAPTGDFRVLQLLRFP